MHAGQVTSALQTIVFCHMLSLHAVHQPGVHRVWAARLVHALADMAASIEPRQNLAICIETHVDGIKPAKQAASGSMSTPLGAHGKGPQWEVYTNQGILRTGAVVHCTNGYASGLLPQLLTHALVPVRNQVRCRYQPHLHAHYA